MARERCYPGGVPEFVTYRRVAPPMVFFVQTPKEILIIWRGDSQVRHLYMNVPHSRNPKPSWYGESVGHFEGDTLVVDTIGQNTKTFVDNYRTPHTDKLRVVERFRIIEGGKRMRIDVHVGLGIIVRLARPDAGEVQMARRVPFGMRLGVNRREVHGQGDDGRA